MTHDVNKVPEEPAESRGPLHRLLGVTRDLALASIGVAGVLSDDAATLYRRSVQRGQDNVRRVGEKIGLIGNLPRPKMPKSVQGLRHAGLDNPSQFTSQEWRAALNKLNVASPKDVDLLAEQVDELEAKVDLLTRRKAAG
jgi:hypothetical protein